MKYVDENRDDEAIRILHEHLAGFDRLLPTQIAAFEKNDIEELIARIERKAIDSSGKKQMEAMLAQQGQGRGVYHSRSDVQTLDASISADRPEERAEFEDRVARTLEDRKYEAVTAVAIVLRELLDNSLKFGCRGIPDGMVKARVRIAPRHVNIHLADPGKGFDHIPILEAAKEFRDTPAGHGNGLRMVLANVLRIKYSGNGNSVEAVIPNNPAEFAAFIAQEKSEVHYVGDIVCFSIVGSLDIYSAPRIIEEVRDLAARSFIRIVFDMSHVSYIDSTGIGVLLKIKSNFESEYPDGGLVLALVTPMNRKILKMSGLDKILMICDTIQDGIEYLRE